MVKPLGGNALLIEPHYLVSLYMEDQLKEMVKEVQDLCKEVVATRFANAGAGSGSASMYIDPMLFHIPLSIGDRSEAVQDTSCALQGTRFPVEGDKVRLGGCFVENQCNTKLFCFCGWWNGKDKGIFFSELL